jgi:hypothetical protein
MTCDKAATADSPREGRAPARSAHPLNGLRRKGAPQTFPLELETGKVGGTSRGNVKAEVKRADSLLPLTLPEHGVPVTQAGGEGPPAYSPEMTEDKERSVRSAPKHRESAGTTPAPSRCTPGRRTK